ncbi:MAG: cellulase family glycosylhydrolase [Candidatus Portnoybacteria bacterium]|nr:cellulase family glycosylhydrolase [Candidatus Portnoybacteria bacterium]
MRKILKYFLIILIVFVLIFFMYFFIGKAEPVDDVEWGVTFSVRPVRDFGLDWKVVFMEMLDDLEVKHVRLIAYWNEIEKEEGLYDFSDLDWQVDKVKEKGGDIILAVGRRLPRWPECFEPDWIVDFNEEEKQERILAFVFKVVNRYKDVENIKIWQVENEPFFENFGDCPDLDKEFLEEEIALVRDLDPSRPIMITESGELSTWIGGARRADILGTSLYKWVHNNWWGYYKYPIPAIFYQRKVALIKLLFDINEVIAVEVQAEPWGHKPNQHMTAEEQDISMSFENFEEIIAYTRKAGFKKAYLWGVEWWYWRMKKFEDNKFWEKAKSLF